MDDDRFKAELLSRLEKIHEALSLLREVSGGSEEPSPAEKAFRLRIAADHTTSVPTIPERAMLKDEMQENYNQAVQRWKAAKVDRMLE